MQTILVSLLLALSVGMVAYLLSWLLFRLWRWLPCTLIWLAILLAITYGILTIGGTGMGITILWILAITSPALVIAFLASMTTTVFLCGTTDDVYTGWVIVVTFLTYFPLNYFSAWGTFLWIDHLTPGNGVGQEYFLSLGIGACSPSIAGFLIWVCRQLRASLDV